MRKPLGRLGTKPLWVRARGGRRARTSAQSAGGAIYGTHRDARDPRRIERVRKGNGA